jgi:putative hemolysin
MKELIRNVTIKHALRPYQSRIRFKIESDSYILRTADNIHDLKQVLRLRHDIFCAEWRGLNLPHGMDLDQFDTSSDHLLIQDKLTGQTVGTYRIRCNLFHKRFYSQTEFQMDDFLRNGDTLIELGRACIAPAFRNGIVMQLLWRGIARYMNMVEADALFGCTSMIGLKQIQLPKLLSTLLPVIDPTLPIAPLPHMNVAKHASLFSWNPDQKNEIPALLEAYIKAGAKVAPFPAVDLEFDCIDILTVLNRNTMSPIFRKRYGL